MTMPITTDSPARRLRDALEPIATHAFRSTSSRQAIEDLGLPPASVYVCGRAAVLGGATTEVVIATFAWFDPARIRYPYEAGIAASDWTAIHAARSWGASETLRDIVSDDPTDAADLLADAVAAASQSGRPLFAARRGRGRPRDPHERLWWACECLREHRGDSHIASALAAGVGPVEMNVLTEVWLGGQIRQYSATRGWSEAALNQAIAGLTARGWLRNDTITDAGRRARIEIEAATDRQDQLVVDHIGARLPELCMTLDGWSALCIAAGAFPPDVFKRAAG
jgi:hypothetical protein